MAYKTSASSWQRTYSKLGDRYKPPKLGDRYKPPPPPPRPGRPGMPPPQTHVVTLGESYLDIAEKYNVEATQVMQGAENLTPIPGTAVSIPDRPKLWEAPGIPDVQKPTPQPLPKVGFETAEPIDVGEGDFIQFPEGWNPAQVLASTEYGSMDFYSKFYGGYYTEYGGLGAEAPRYHPDWGRPYTDAAMYGTPTEALPEIPGIPTYHAWTKDETTGAWERQEEGAVFDALYEMNNIDPTDDDMVEWFWSMADEDLLGVGILFDVLDWGDEDGYGYPAPPAYGLGTPSRMYGRGQKPVRGEYASYLGLTSWSI